MKCHHIKEASGKIMFEVNRYGLPASASANNESISSNSGKSAFDEIVFATSAAFLVVVVIGVGDAIDDGDATGTAVLRDGVGDAIGVVVDVLVLLFELVGVIVVAVVGVATDDCVVVVVDDGVVGAADVEVDVVGILMVAVGLEDTAAVVGALTVLEDGVVDGGGVVDFLGTS
jgi:hypothetical protein